MSTAGLVLEYLKVLLSGPVLFSLVALVVIIVFREDIKALILRIAKIKLPGGTEFDTPQSKQLDAEEEKPAPEPRANDEMPILGLPEGLTAEQRERVEQVIRAHIATAYTWEYRYLNYFLARGTQVVLDWLINLPQPTTYAHFDSTWLPLIPSAEERQAIIGALRNHHLIQQDEAELISVTPKGREYQQWRGPLPPLTNGSTGRS
ncbi:hypothetical protein [uncultured Marinobacter sp.]|uniref:hypothetical protein n=1 Tax=uncultured Marinobacter sp. TaxID=187379 RepID=UPI00261C9162|nr:hypothetical protein [uncultured Marinobacter sp.]